MKQTSKNLRHTLFEQQDHKCPVCGTTIPDLSHAYYDPLKQYMTCIPCNFVVLHFRKMVQRGVTLHQIIEYEERDAQPIPDKLKRHQTPAQEAKRQQARQAVADGRWRTPDGHVKTVEEYDDQFGA